MKKTFISAMTSLILLSSICIISIFAFTGEDMPDIDSTKKCNLTVEVLDGTKPIEGFELSVYKVADIVVQPSHTVVYKPVSGLEGLVDYDGMTVEESKTAAKTLESKVSSITPGKTTDESGIAKYLDLEPGMYLVVNTKRSLLASKYMTLSSFLVSVPGIDKGETENTWIYDVKAVPKTAPKLIPDPYIPPMTGVE